MSPVSIAQGRLRPTQALALVKQFLDLPTTEFDHTDERVTSIEATPDETIIYTLSSHGEFSYLVVFEDNQPSYLEAQKPSCSVCAEEVAEAEAEYLRIIGWRA